MPEDEVCGICRVQFDGTCPTCKHPGDDCTLRLFNCSLIIAFILTIFTVIGKCGHSFHMVPKIKYRHHAYESDEYLQHCILTWIQQDSAKGQCPMCRQSENPLNGRMYFLTRIEFEWKQGDK